MAVPPALGRSCLGILAVVLSACGGDSGSSVQPTPLATGIEVSNQTSGDPIEDGYTVTVDAASARPLPVNDRIVFSDLEPGDHSVELGGVEPDCTVLGANPRTVHALGGTAQSVFLVTCSVAGTGRIHVETFTYGEGPPDGYRVTMDGGRFVELEAKDDATFSAVPVGPVTLTLTGEGPGCEVTAPNPRTLQVHEHEQLLSLFKIHCPA